MRFRLALCSLGCALVMLTGCVGYVMRDPPPPRYGAVGVAPGPRYVWADGYWGWRGNAYVWVPGAWVVPPRHYAVWVPAHWVRRPRHWVFVRGHWR